MDGDGGVVQESLVETLRSEGGRIKIPISDIIELDGERCPLNPGTAIMIKPGCRHRAVGKLKILNVPVPKFDLQDEWFD